MWKYKEHLIFLYLISEHRNIYTDILYRDIQSQWLSLPLFHKLHSQLYLANTDQEVWAYHFSVGQTMGGGYGGPEGKSNVWVAYNPSRGNPVLSVRWRKQWLITPTIACQETNAPTGAPETVVPRSYGHRPPGTERAHHSASGRGPEYGQRGVTVSWGLRSACPTVRVNGQFRSWAGSFGHTPMGTSMTGWSSLAGRSMPRTCCTTL